MTTKRHDYQIADARLAAADEQHKRAAGKALGREQLRAALAKEDTLKPNLYDAASQASVVQDIIARLQARRDLVEVHYVKLPEGIDDFDTEQLRKRLAKLQAALAPLLAEPAREAAE